MIQTQTQTSTPASIQTPAPAASAPLLSVRDLAVHFPVSGGGGRTATVKAVDGVSFELARGRTLAIVGESGSGKTTTALSVLRLSEPTAGVIHFDGQDLTALRGEPLRRMRRRLQLVFQDPYSSLNPRQRAGDIVRAPLDLMDIGPAAGARRAWPRCSNWWACGRTSRRCIRTSSPAASGSG